MMIHTFEATTIQGETISLERYQGKVLLIVNTASQCGFTPQFEGLQKLYERYRGQGLEILGFPCNQFGQQDPGSNEEIATFCQMNYGVSFPMFARIEVNGPSEHPLYTYLKGSLGGLMGRAIKWNFTKFLIDRSGKPVKRFGPQVAPEKLEAAILRYL